MSEWGASTYHAKRNLFNGMGMDMGGAIPTEYTLVLNSSSALITKLAAMVEGEKEKALLMAKDIYRLALISQRQMTADELTAFLADSFKLLGML